MSLPKIAAVLVFHDWNGPARWEEWAELGLDFFQRVGAVPNTVSYNIGQSFRTVLPKTLPKVLKKPDLGGFDIYQLRPPFKDFGRHAASAEIIVNEIYRKALFSYDSDELDTELFSSLTAKFSDLSGTTYGIGYLRPTNRGPAYYASGTGYSVPGDPTSIVSAEESEEIYRWGRARRARRHLDGFLRDVYPFNVLTVPHLRRIVFGQPLATWIGNDAAHGALREVANGVWTWVLTTQQLPPVQSALATQGLLLAKTSDR